jgi:tetratricopeptide (TPR) repeat protein
VQLLLLCGADPTAKAQSGETPIDLARATRADNLLKMMMIASGQEPQSVDSFLQQIQPDESKWEKLYTAGKRANELGHLAEAEKLFYEALQEAEKFAHLDLRLANTLKVLGRVYENTGRQDYAKPLYDRFVEIMERADAKRDPEYVDHLMHLAESRASAGDFRMAAEYAWSVLAGARFNRHPPPPVQNRPSYERALEIVASNPALDSSNFESLAHFYLALGRLNEAEHFLIAAVRTLQYPELYYSLRGLASFYERQQKHEQAKAVREDIEAIKRIHGEPNQKPWG